MDLTILMVARNAGPTIGRAVRSCVPEQCPIILIDDGSEDKTVVNARQAGAADLRVVRAPRPGGLGAVRHLALELVETRFAAWLDADDEWIPGRASRLSVALEAGHDVAVESIALHDGPSSSFLRALDAPPFLMKPGGAVRLFERNFLPGDTQVAFRVQAFRSAGGYDASIYGPESFDLLLRALRNGARFWFGSEVGYRMHAYPSSVSRNLLRQREALARVLRKHDYAAVDALYRRYGHSPRVAAWAMVIMAQQRNELGIALDWLERASPRGADPDDVLEAEGPWPYPEGWRRAFHRGSILLRMAGRVEEAIHELERASTIWDTDEGLNNIGVAWARSGRHDRARQAFVAALARRPGYADARLNLGASKPDCITNLPLRRHPSRTDYLAA